MDTAFRRAPRYARPLAYLVVCLCLALNLIACSHSKSTAEAAAATAAPANSTQNTAAAPSAPDPQIPADNAPPPQFDGARALQDTRDVVAFGPRYVGSPGHKKTEQWIRKHVGEYTTGGATLETDSFTAHTPFGAFPMTNYIAKFPGTKDGIIVVAGHYDTIYDRNDFVGANDGGSSTGLPAELARELASGMHGGKRDGYSVWVVFLDGEEAFQQWRDNDNTYGSRHLAEKWQADGTLPKIRAFLLVDMIGDADLNIEQDSNSTQSLEKLVYAAAQRLGYQSHFFNRRIEVGDDHVPFVQRGVPSADLIDFDYGYNNAYWHTKDDTMDKLSADSFNIVGSVVLETIRLIDKQ